MNRRVLSVLIFGVLFAGSATLLLYRLMMNRVSQTPPTVATQPILVAARELAVGQMIKDEDLAVAVWHGAIPPGTILKKSDAVGRSVSSTIFEKEPVVQNRLAAPGTGNGLAVFIPTGMRAVGVRVNEVVGVAGFVLPGSHVDVIASGQMGSSDETGSAMPITRTVLQNLTVLSAGQDFKQSPDGKPIAVQVVNLLVTPQQAEILSLAGNQTTIQLILRNALDKGVVETKGIALNSLLGDGARPAPAPPRHAAAQPVPVPAPVPAPAPIAVAVKAPDTVEIIMGTKRMEVSPGEVH